MIFIAITRCLNSKKIDKNTHIMNFHFKGVYRGKKIKKVQLNAQKDAFIPGLDYILILDSIKIIDENLLCNLKKYRMLL